MICRESSSLHMRIQLQKYLYFLNKTFHYPILQHSGVSELNHLIYATLARNEVLNIFFGLTLTLPLSERCIKEQFIPEHSVYSDDVNLLRGSAQTVQWVVSGLAMEITRQCFAPLVCNLLLQEWRQSVPSLPVRGDL